MTVIEFCRKIVDNWKFWKKLASEIRRSPGLQPHIYYPCTISRNKTWSAHSEGKMVLLDSRFVFRSGRRAANENLHIASLDTMTNFRIFDIIFGLIVDWWRFFGHQFKFYGLILMWNRNSILAVRIDKKWTTNKKYNFWSKDDYDISIDVQKIFINQQWIRKWHRRFRSLSLCQAKHCASSRSQRLDPIEKQIVNREATHNLWIKNGTK